MHKTAKLVVCLLLFAGIVLAPALADTLAPSVGVMFGVVRYFGYCASDGDWLNDWITHVPLPWHEQMIVVGKWMACQFAGDCASLPAGWTVAQ